MKKFLLPGILAVLSLFLPSRSQAVPLDVPFAVSFSTTNLNQLLVVSTATFPSANTTWNSNVALYQWCFDRLTISASAADNFSIYWATSTISNGTTDYMVTTAAGVPFDADLSYREPYCAPVGQPIVTLKSSVGNSTATISGYLFKGWNP